uniref:Craniofacial development protein 1 n=1 Tax=Leptobrachium leishanense TaxID=445787 RepID=A0A8C5MK91_9ANUR
MSDYDSEDYSSSEDEDYVPSGGEYSEDDVNELVKEDDEEGEEDGCEKSSGTKTKRKKVKCISARKRRKGVLVLNSEDKTEEDKEAAHSPEEEEEGSFHAEKQNRKEELKKKKEDDLWSSFLSDVGQKSKSPSPRPVTTSSQVTAEKQEEANTSLPPSTEKSKQKENAKVTITKVFDFAGEEVRVTKEVDSSSKEAKAFIQQQEISPQEPNRKPSVTSLPTGSGVKRPGGMSNVLGKLGSKKQKMSTLEKSKLDWETFKDQEGIGDELAIHNRGKNGYIERKAFLDRVDYRQFELEREIRLKNMKQ